MYVWGAWRGLGGGGREERRPGAGFIWVRSGWWKNLSHLSPHCWRHKRKEETKPKWLCSGLLGLHTHGLPLVSPWLGAGSPAPSSPLGMMPSGDSILSCSGVK